MNQIKSIIIAAVILLVIGSLVGMTVTRHDDAAKHKPPQATRQNVCLLLDLSDRISPSLQPLQVEKDKRTIGALVDLFEEDVKKKLYVNSMDSIRVAVAEQPTGYGETLLKISDAMTIDMSDQKPNKKRDEFPKQKERFLSKVEELYQVASSNTAYAGADIWRFFREDLDKYRITGTSEAPVRNVLVVVTDGYITFGDQKNRPRAGSRASYMEVSQFRHNGWEKEFDRRDSGLISGMKHPDWEVLVLQVNPHKTEDLPIISKYWSKWFDEMGISNYRIEKTNDSTRLSRQVIASFLNQAKGTQKVEHVAKAGAH
ncbi:MAG: hypothetical protein WCP10_15135 [Desulfuromonadales bacterium]